MQYTFMKTADIIEDDKAAKLENRDSKCPIVIGTIPNYMGINLCSVEGIGWLTQNDNQLVNVTIYFIPAVKEKTITWGHPTGEFEEVEIDSSRYEELMRQMEASGLTIDKNSNI